MIGSAPIVAGTISLAMGAALALQIRGEKRVSVSFFGDGAAGEGVLHESMNFASLRKLPLIFVCENNFYSTHLPIRECRSKSEIFELGRPFNIKCWQIDGNNVLKVYEAAQKAVALCRCGDGPLFIECKTYRQRGHVGPDDNIQGIHFDIRPAEEIAKWKKKDPIERFERFLLRNGILDKKDLWKAQKEIEAEIRSAHEFATNSPYPDREGLKDYVFREQRSAV
jgi:pyruvate dehydrogenase E1 component alpha subunit